MTFSKSPPAGCAAFTVLLMVSGGKIFWPNSFPLEMLIQQSWNQLISSFWGNTDWPLESDQPSHARNSPKKWSSLTLGIPNNLFHGVSWWQGFQCFLPSAKQERQQQELPCPLSQLPATPFDSSAIQQQPAKANSEPQGTGSCLVRGLNAK